MGGRRERQQGKEQRATKKDSAKFIEHGGHHVTAGAVAETRAHWRIGLYNISKVVLNLILYATAVLAAVGVVLYVVGLYNQMVSSAREVERAFANVEVSLKQRHDEIPALVDICRGYIKHERELLETIAAARGRFEASTDSNGKVAAENELVPNLGRLFALSEAYPELCANDLFNRISRRLTAIENEIADRRELFNASATAYNTYVQVVPQRFLATLTGFRPRLLLDL